VAEQSPFHEGELEVQERIGVREKIGDAGRRSIRSFMPEQHQTFFGQLPTFFVGSVDDRGRPWASVLCGAPGFVRAIDPQTLRIDSLPGEQDPLAANLRAGARIGGLGLEFETRRRNRVNGHVTVVDKTGFELRVDQSFGNCAQYIQTRRRGAVINPDAKPQRLLSGSGMDARSDAIVRRADTLFIASSHPGQADARSDGVDVSHRGGLPGFVAIEDRRTVLVPDYRGNFFFNTLGNILRHPACGMLFLDFERGHVVQMTGSGEIIWEASDTVRFPGAFRLVRFHIEEVLFAERAFPLSWEFLSFAPQFTRA
jgi:predicted pyridoxine 5'-phosphate oxidase superfamily flavin-nucleotide-binding protein